MPEPLNGFEVGKTRLARSGHPCHFGHSPAGPACGARGAITAYQQVALILPRSVAPLPGRSEHGSEAPSRIEIAAMRSGMGAWRTSEYSEAKSRPIVRRRSSSERRFRSKSTRSSVLRFAAAIVATPLGSTPQIPAYCWRWNLGSNSYLHQ
jgi:hypothetical protein